MQRIATASKYANKFGAGKHGFGETPVLPMATHLSSGWFDGVQEELARLIEDQGLVLDAGDYEQLLTVLHSFQFAGLAGIASGGILEFKAGSEAYVDPAAIFTFGGVPEFQGGAVFSTGGTMQLNAAVTLLAQGPSSFSQLIGADGGISIGAGQSIYGDDAMTTIEGFGYIESAIFAATALGRVETRRLQFTGSATPDVNFLVMDSDGDLNFDEKKVHRSTNGFIPQATASLSSGSSYTATAKNGTSLTTVGDGSATMSAAIQLKAAGSVLVEVSGIGLGTNANDILSLDVVADHGATTDDPVIPEWSTTVGAGIASRLGPGMGVGIKFTITDTNVWTFRLRYKRNGSGGAGPISIFAPKLTITPLAS